MKEDHSVLDLGCGTGVFGFIYLSVFSNINIDIIFTDCSEAILGNTLYNFRNLLFSNKVTKATFIKSDMFDDIPTEKPFHTILANLPQTPFQDPHSKPDKNGGHDSLLFNKKLLESWQIYSTKQLIMLYSYMCWP